MSRIPYTPPKHGESAFNCPWCNAYAEQTWSDLIFRGGAFTTIPNSHASRCARCGAHAIWYREGLILPSVSPAPLPNPDLPKEIQQDYLEARDILAKSPRGAAALLRLAIQKFCKNLGESGKDLNADIASLVTKGLPVMAQQALDTVRVIGNNAVHPGQIDLRDDPGVAGTLFELLNVICEYTVTQPKKVAEIYSKLPAGQREAIKKRYGS